MQNLVILRCCCAEDGQNMFNDLKRPCIMINKHLTGSEKSRGFCFPETLKGPRGESRSLNVPGGEAERYIWIHMLRLNNKGKQSSLFPVGPYQSLSVRLYLLTQNGKQMRNFSCFLLDASWDNNFSRFQ